MIALTTHQIAELGDRLLPELPGSLVGSHVSVSGHGRCVADRWPQPRAVLVEAGGNYMLRGDPGVVSPEQLRPHITGFVDASEEFWPLLAKLTEQPLKWHRVVYVGERKPSDDADERRIARRLTGADAHHLRQLSDESAWISKTWSGPDSLAATELAWGVFDEGRLVSVACPFFMGLEHEDIGVVTEPAYRKQGLSTACARALCRDITDRGHTPVWTTSPDNIASIRLAERLGFRKARSFILHVIGIDIPEVAAPVDE